MNFTWALHKKKNKVAQSNLGSYLLSKNYVIHDVKDGGKTVVYVNNMKTVLIRENREVEGLKLGAVIFDIGGSILINIKFIPSSITLFELMIKQAVANYELTK